MHGVQRALHDVVREQRRRELFGLGLELSAVPVRVWMLMMLCCRVCCAFLCVVVCLTYVWAFQLHAGTCTHTLALTNIHWHSRDGFDERADVRDEHGASFVEQLLDYRQVWVCGEVTAGLRARGDTVEQEELGQGHLSATADLLIFGVEIPRFAVGVRH